MTQTKPAKTNLPPLPPLKRTPFREGRPIEEEGVDVPNLLGLVDLDSRSCRWPHGDPREPGFGFCGKPIVDGKRIGEGESYCAEHKRRSLNSA